MKKIQEPNKKRKRCKNKTCVFKKLRKKKERSLRNSARKASAKLKKSQTMKKAVKISPMKVQNASFFSQSLGPFKLPSRKELRRAKTNELLDIEPIEQNKK